ncbi:hypothetical protein Sp14A_05910 [Streptococcus pluranimalium]|uniref:Uncharacterized protein n=1 Tax=Streptococcus pluranimalium TaxID=82348 RepID=A0A345VIG9_9STRE|nr:hypothetical protein Sp14A_05510 [Streptococcus pluranimalium]AXJ12521.1 hypothetical protein Sp14A_05910 [Streptococcus pluranimalium]
MIYRHKIRKSSAVVVDYQSHALQPRDYCDFLNTMELSDEDIARKTNIPVKRITRIRLYDLPTNDEIQKIERIFKRLR